MIWKRGVAVAAILGLAAVPCLASVPARTKPDGAKLLRSGNSTAKKAANTKYDAMLVRHGGFGGFRGGFGRGGFGRVGFGRGFGGFGRGFGRFGIGRGFGFRGFRGIGFGRGFGFNRFGGFGRGFGFGGFFPGFGLGLGLGSLFGYGGYGYGYPYYGGYGYGYPYYGGYGGYGYGYSPYVYQTYYYPGYTYMPYYYSPISYSYPIGGAINGTGGAYTPPIMPPAGDGTYPYNGGPSSPVPLPQAQPLPSRDTPRQAAPAEGRIVSVPAPAKTKFAYRAYGEQETVTSFAQDRTVPVNKPSIAAAHR